MEKRKEYLSKITNWLQQCNSDTLKSEYFSITAYEYYLLADSLNFRIANNKALTFSLLLKDSERTAKHYWDLGNFFRKEKPDSAYFCFFKAGEIYRKIGDRENTANMLLNMAIIQKNIKDYTGSEITTTQAIAILKPLNKTMQLIAAYNNLGIIFNELEDYERAIYYYKRKLALQKKIKKQEYFEISTLNNIGVVYQNQGKYKKAVGSYLDALEKYGRKPENTSLYARLLDNLAYAKFHLKDTEQLPEMYYRALEIRDSLKNVQGIIMSKLHLSEYYAFTGDTVAAINFAQEAKISAASSEDNKDLLASLELLSKFDKKNGIEYLNQHIQLSNHLQKEERKNRNKFARIRFETDEFIDKSERLQAQKRIITIVSIITVVVILLLYIISSQRARNKKLLLERQQQRANERTYNILLEQQIKLEEERRKEQNRISKELHDGVLGRLFGTRLSLDSLNDKRNGEAIKIRGKYIDELKSIEEEIRGISHGLSVTEVVSGTGYIELISRLLENQSKISNFEFNIKTDDFIQWDEIRGEVKINIYRIIQEAVQNINKYAQAQNVIIHFRKKSKKLHLLIMDDGVGFNIDKKVKGIGLKNIKSRTKSLKGKTKIESKVNEGTRITIELPLKYFKYEEARS